MTLTSLHNNPTWDILPIIGLLFVIILLWVMNRIGPIRREYSNSSNPKEVKKQ